MKQKLITIFALILFTFSMNAQIIISQYIETNSGTIPKGIELWNVSGTTIDFSVTNLDILKGVNGGTPTSDILINTGTLADGEVIVVGTSDLSPDYEKAFSFNGDDALVIQLNGVTVDVFGIPGSDPGAGWTGNGIQTNDQNIQLKTGITTGDTDGWTDPSERFELVSDDPVNDITGFGIAPTSSSTNDQTSTVTAGTMPAAATISSIAPNDSTAVLQFTITDAGGDGLPTVVTGMNFVAGPNNTFDFNQDITGGTIYDISANTINLIAGNPAATSNSIFLPTAISVPEGSSVTFEAAIYAQALDGAILQLQINASSHGFTAAATGSDFEDPFTGGDIVGNDFTYEVVATQLSFTQQPTDVLVNATISPAVVVGATDVNGNVDVDYANTDITLSYLGGTMSGTNPVQTANGIATFSDLTIDTEQANAAIGATDGTWSITSDMFNVILPPMTTLPYTQTFDADLGDTYTYNVSGATKEWYFDGDKATMNGYNSGDIEEDWLILPGINLDNYSNEIMSFTSEYQYGNDDATNYLKLLYSADYSGMGDPSSATWTELTFTQPTSSTTATPSGDIDLSAITGTNVYIAFKYHYEAVNYRKWSIDNINIAGAVNEGGADCANAVLITPRTHHAIHTQEGDGSIYDQWYKFVAPYSGTATVENCASDVDIYLLIQAGTCGNDYDMADEDNCGASGLAENFTFNITSGETYFIGIGNRDQATTAEYDWTLSFSDIIPVNSIALLRAGTQGQKYQLTSEAVITYMQSYRNQKFIQDATAAILIDDNGGTITTTFNQYDGITGLVGTLGSYNDMLQFIPESDPGAASSTGNTVTSQTITLAQFTANFEDYEAELITINDITFADAGATFATGTLYSVSDASKGTANFRTNFYDADYIGGTVPGTATSVTGLCIDKGTAGDGITFTARNLADIVLPPLSTDASLNSLTTDNGTLDPVFATGTFAYTVALPSGTTSTPTVIGVATDDNASVSVVPATDITSSTDADRTTTVTVVAEDLTTVQDYTVVFNVAVSVNSINANSISVYPNPSNGTFTINVKENFNLEVIDIAGKVLQTKNINSNTTINISNAGVYFLHFSNENGTIVKRVIVQ